MIESVDFDTEQRTDPLGRVHRDRPRHDRGHEAVKLMILIEDQFAGVEITGDDADRMEVVGDLIRYLIEFEGGDSSAARSVLTPKADTASTPEGEVVLADHNYGTCIAERDRLPSLNLDLGGDCQQSAARHCGGA